MRKIYCIVLALGMGISCAMAQAEIGIRGGLTHNKTFGFQKAGFGAHLGLTANFAIGDRVSLQSEFVYVQRGGRETGQFVITEILDETSVSTTSFNYRIFIYRHTIDLPFLVQYRLSPKLSLLAGPQWNLLFAQSGHGRIAGERSKAEISGYKGTVAFGFSGGAAYRLNNQLALELRYNHELLFNRIPNKTWQLGVNYSLGNWSELKERFSGAKEER